MADPGGNWLRFSRLGDSEESSAADDSSTGLDKVIDNAARLGDAKDDAAAALRLIDNGLTRFEDAPVVVTARALLYRVDLCVRLGESLSARADLVEVEAMALSADEREVIAEELSHATELVSNLG